MIKTNNPPTRDDRDELDNFKTNIDLVEFARLNGFEYSKGFTNKNHETTHIVLDKKDTDEHIIVNRNPSTKHWQYFCPENHFDKGTIIDFCSNRLQLNLGAIRQKLRPYVGLAASKEKMQIHPALPLKQRVIDEKYFALKPLDSTYLKTRHLSEAVINNPIFFGTIGTRDIEFKNEQKQVVKTYHNTAFVIKNTEEKTIGLALKNKYGNDSSFKQTFSESSTLGMWMSNTPEHTSNLKFAISENPIDGMSHFQLKYDQLTADPQIKYFASNGVVRDAHIEHVQFYIDKLRPKEVSILGDNDNPGLRFAINYLGQLKQPADVQGNVRFYADEDVKIKCMWQKPINMLVLELQNNAEVSHVDVLENVNTYFLSKNEELYKKYDYKKEEFKIETISQTESLTEIKISFDNRRELLMDAINITQYLRPNNQLKIELPNSKDFNQDLENISSRKKIKKEELLDNSNDFSLGK